MAVRKTTTEARDPRSDADRGQVRPQSGQSSTWSIDVLGLWAKVPVSGSPEVALHGFTADNYWPDHGVVVEVDSYGFHNGRWAYERDRRKDAAFRAHDLETMRFSRPQVLDEPLLVIGQIAAALGAAERHAR